MSVESKNQTINSVSDNSHANSSVGKWIEEFACNRNLGIKKFGEEIGLNGIYGIRNSKPEDISLYSLQVLLEGADRFNANPDEIDQLADAVEESITAALDIKGKLYTRIPPRVPSVMQKEMSGDSYRDVQFEEKSGISANSLFKARKKLGIGPVYTQEDAERIIDFIYSNDREKSENAKKYMGTFALEFCRLAGVSERDFIKQVIAKTSMSNYQALAIKKKRNPTPEEFGLILEAFALDEKKRDELAGIWLNKFREQITLKDLAKEYNLTLGSISRIAAKFGYSRNNWGWKGAEAVRNYRSEMKYIEREKNGSSGDEEKEKKVTGIRLNNGVAHKVGKQRVAIIEKKSKKDREQIITVVSDNNRPEYPNVVTDEYLVPLVSFERNAVEKLRGSSFSSPVQLMGNERFAADYLIKERIFPVGASIRRKEIEGKIVYYFEYKRA